MEKYNIQIIDGADNATFEIFQANYDDFVRIFPNGQELEFSGDFFERDPGAGEVWARLWKQRVIKKDVVGIHGTLFCGDDIAKRKRCFPNKMWD